MSDLEVCRICLSKGVKVYNYDLYNLKQCYEQIMAKNVNIKDGLPHFFCYICAAILYKFHKFKEKCHTGEEALRALIWNGPITIKSVSKIDRQGKKLTSSIDILTVSKRVKIKIMKHKTLNESLTEMEEVNKIETTKESLTSKPEIEENKKVSDSDYSLDNQNLAEITKEKAGEVDVIINTMKEHNIEKAEERIITNFGDDEIFSQDVDLNLENVVDPEEESDDEMEFRDENINDTTEQTINDNEKTSNKNHTITKKNENKNLSGVHKKKKVRKNKFEVVDTKINNLDPNHWLTVNLSEEEALTEFTAREKDRKYLNAAYKCTDCFKGFSKKDILDRHIILKHNKSIGPVECRFCKMCFKLTCFLTRHLPTHYTKYKCLRCELTCTSDTSALLHNDYHNGVIRKCKYCGDEFRHSSTYYTHLRTHRSEHVCTLCGASFVSATGLGFHKKIKHVNADSKHVNADSVPKEEKDTYCMTCDINFETFKAYDEHLFHSAKHAVSSGDPSADPSVERKGEYTRRNSRKIIHCAICNTNFPHYKAYTKHHTAEHKGKPRTITDSQIYNCEFCGVSLQLPSLRYHMNKHTCEKIFTCDTCQMTFTSKGSLSRHQLTHTREKPYKCDLCKKRFTQNGSMRLHYRTLHLKQPYPKRNRRQNIVTPQEFECYTKNGDSEKNVNIDRRR